MINIFLTVDVSGFSSGYIIVEIVDAAAPSVTVDFQAFSQPSVNPGNIQFTGLPEATYIINIYQNSSPAVGGTRLRTYTIDKSMVNQEDREDLYLIADTTPGLDSGTRIFTDPNGLLTGWNYSLESKGVGTLLAGGVDYTQLSVGFQMADPDYQFGTGEVFVVHFRSSFTVSAPQPVNAGVLFTPNTVYTADTVLTAADKGQFILIQGASATIAMTLPPGSTMVTNTMMAFLSEGGSHIMASIVCDGSDTIEWLGRSNSTLYMGQGEILWLFWDGTNWRVANSDGNFKTVGERVGSYSLTGLNLLQCKGQLVLRANYPRLWEWVNNQLDPALLITEATWNLQDPTTLKYLSKGKFSTGDLSTNFRLPVWHPQYDTPGGTVIGGTGFFRGVDGVDRLAGTFETDSVGNFKAAITGKIVRKAESANRTLVALNHLPPDGDLGSSSVNNVPFTGQDPISGDDNNQTKPANTGEYALIRL